MKLTIGSVVVVAMAAAVMGCSVHAQAPIKEVAYDFSDRDFYDRAYAPSPDYSEQAPAPVAEHTPASCQSASDCETSPCGCGRVQVEHYHHHAHYYEAEPPRRRGAPARPKPRAEAEVQRGDEAAEDTRQAQRPTRSRPAVHVDEAEVDEAPANRAGRTSITRGEDAAPAARRPASPPIIAAPPASPRTAQAGTR